MSKNVVIPIFAGKKRTGIGETWEVYISPVPAVKIQGFPLNQEEVEHIISFAIEREIQNALGGINEESKVQKILAEILRNIKESGTISSASGEKKVDSVTARARGLVAKILQGKGMKAKEAATVASRIFRGEEDPEKHGLPADIVERARQKAKEQLERERQLLDDLLA